MKDYSKVDSEVNAVSNVIWEMATNVWKFSELGYEEVTSAAYTSAALEKYGFKISGWGIGGIDTSWIATWGKGSPVIGILVEFDALPGLGNETGPELLKSIQDEFARRIKDKPYKNLNELAAPVQGKLDSRERNQYECCIHAAMDHFGIKEDV